MVAERILKAIHGTMLPNNVIQLSRSDAHPHQVRALLVEIGFCGLMWDKHRGLGFIRAQRVF